MRSAAAACVAYAAVTVVLTWPLSAGLAHDIPGDFGDPLFTSWVLAWDATHLGIGWWHANIFAPHPLALAYSEHFLPQALEVLPVYLATRNPILSYNLVFLSTFVLSGLGMFLFARELTRDVAASFVAGLAYAFTPYRIASIPHLQVLSAAWMPFVLYGLRRHFDTRRLAPLAGAAAAWIVQNLSCGYYLLFFSPIVGFYIGWELWARRLWRDRRELMRVAAACAIVAAATLPFLLPYMELRRLGFNPRSLAETRRFSADVYAYFTADPNLRFWGPLLQTWPHAEGILFPGLTIVVLAARGLLAPAAQPPRREPRRIAARLAVVAYTSTALILLLGYSIRADGLKITSFSRVAIAGVAAASIVLALSRRSRVSVAGWLRTPAAWLALVAAFAVAMSFGPDIRAKGRTVANANVYTLAYEYVPGFDGLRVPARYAMIASLALAALAGLGLAKRSSTRASRVVCTVAALLIVLEAFAVPIPINQNSTEYRDPSLAPLPPYVAVGAATPPAYGRIAQLPASTVLMELPLGEPAFDIRYMFYSTTHWRRLVNGYSGGAPLEYEFLTESLREAQSRPARAWQAIVDSAATHVLVHEGFYKAGTGARISKWLRASGGREVASFGSDRLFALRR